MPTRPVLSKRQRQIMDVLFECREASAAEVQERLPDPPTYTAVRTMLRILEEKGLVAHRQDGRRYVYWPVTSVREEGRSAFKRLLQVFFGGSLEEALAAHLSDPKVRLAPDELRRLRELVEGQAQAPRRSRPARSRRQ